MDKIVYNGTIVSRSEPFAGIENRALRYGDGIFESIIQINGKIPLLQYHINRLSGGINVLKIQPGFDVTPAFFREEINKLSESGNARIRISIIRKAGGLYKPSSNEADFLIEAYELDPELTSFPETNGKKVDVCQTQNVLSSPVSHLKTLNAIPYVLASIEAEENAMDDLILTDPNGYLVESTNSNLFVVFGSTIATPPLSSGCINGVIRQYMLDNQKRLGIAVDETKIPLASLPYASEIWLTGGTSGIKWVEEFRNRRLSNKLRNQTQSRLNELLFS